MTRKNRRIKTLKEKRGDQGLKLGREKGSGTVKKKTSTCRASRPLLGWDDVWGAKQERGRRPDFNLLIGMWKERNIRSERMSNLFLRSIEVMTQMMRRKGRVHSSWGILERKPQLGGNARPLSEVKGLKEEEKKGCMSKSRSSQK